MNIIKFIKNHRHTQTEKAQDIEETEYEPELYYLDIHERQCRPAEISGQYENFVSSLNECGKKYGLVFYNPIIYIARKSSACLCAYMNEVPAMYKRGFKLSTIGIAQPSNNRKNRLFGQIAECIAAASDKCGFEQVPVTSMVIWSKKHHQLCEIYKTICDFQDKNPEAYLLCKNNQFCLYALWHSDKEHHNSPAAYVIHLSSHTKQAAHENGSFEKICELLFEWYCRKLTQKQWIIDEDDFFVMEMTWDSVHGIEKRDFLYADEFFSKICKRRWG